MTETQGRQDQPLYVDVTINGVEVKKLKVTTARNDGFCDFHRRKFPAGTQIAFLRKDYLTPAQRQAIFGDRPPYNLTIIWPLQRETNVPRREALAARKKKFTPNQYQTLIREKLFGTTRHLFVSALAGCTKTSTALWLCEELGLAGATRGRQCVYLAFNASIKDEVRLPLTGTGVRGYTTHGWMLNYLLKKAYPSFDLDEGINEHRTADLFLKAICDDAGYGLSDSGKREARQLPQYKMASGVEELVGLLKNWAILPTAGAHGWEFSAEQRQRVLDLVVEYRVVVEHPYTAEDYADMALRVAVMSLPKAGEPVTEIDFDDMLWMPLALGLEFPTMHLVVTDESQDFNACQVLILHKLVQQGARVVVIGDEFQACYRFRGADCRAFQRILGMLKTTQRGVEECELPLNYRCGRAIIRNANRWVPALQGAREEEGEVNPNTAFADAADRLITNDGKSKAVICRVNAPLVVTAYYLMSRMIQEMAPADRKAVCVLGKKTAAAPLKSLISSLCRGDDDRPRTDRLSDRTDQYGNVLEQGFLGRLREYRRTQQIKLGSDPRYALRLEETLNNCTCLEVIASVVTDDSVRTVVEQIDSLFVEKVADPKKTIVCATAHRAKGLEWDEVEIIRPDLLPHPLAMPNEDGSWSDEQQQEENLCYITATRARDYLGYVTDWPFKEGKPLTGLAGAPGQALTAPRTIDPLAVVPEERGMVWVPPPIRSEGPARRATDGWGDDSNREEWTEEPSDLESDLERTISDSMSESENRRHPAVLPTPSAPAAPPPGQFVDDGEPF
jgi:hypothetical protein